MRLSDPRFDRVTSTGGRAAGDVLLSAAENAGWHMIIRGKLADWPGTFIPHVQFRRTATERPYPFSLVLNPETPTFYVRCPTDRQHLIQAFDGAHLNTGREVKIPVPDARVAKRIADRFLSDLRVS